MQFPTDLVIFTEEILNGKLHFRLKPDFQVKTRSIQSVVISLIT